MKKAFTLVEIIFVLGMIAILLGIAVPSFKGMNDESQISRVSVDLAILKSSLDAYYTQYGQYPSAAATGGYQEELLTKTKLITKIYYDPYTAVEYRYLRPDNEHFILISPGINKEYEFDLINAIIGNKLTIPTGSDDQLETNYIRQ